MSTPSPTSLSNFRPVLRNCSSSSSSDIDESERSKSSPESQSEDESLNQSEDENLGHSEAENLDQSGGENSDQSEKRSCTSERSDLSPLTEDLSSDSNYSESSSGSSELDLKHRNHHKSKKLKKKRDNFSPSPPRVQPVGRPLPFFNSTTVIDDYFEGDYENLALYHIPFRPTFIFYYAPWDADSIHARTQFQLLGEYFERTKPGLVKFSAVNCWWPEGQCRMNFKGLSHYPILVAHVASASGVIYNGPIRVELMIRFLESVLKPLSRIDSEDELWRFRASHDSVMLTSFNSTEPDFEPSYNTYRQIALRNLESDPFSQVGYGIFLQRSLGDKFYLSSPNTISLVLFNEIHTAKWLSVEKEMSPVSQVAEWVFERNKNLPLTWSYALRPGFGARPSSLSPFNFNKNIEKGPVFLLLTRKYHPTSFSPFYNLVKIVALDYFNCNRSGNVTKLRRMTHLVNAEWMSWWKSLSQICEKEPDEECDFLRTQLHDWNSKKSALIREPLKNYEKIVKELDFSGLSCRSTRPFKFIAVDPVDVPNFSPLILGLDTNSTYGKDPIAFIIDAQNDLIVPYTTFNISFLAQTLKSYTLSVENGAKFETQTPNFYKSSKIEASSQLITDFNSETLLDFLAQNSNSSLFLMFHAQYCGYCGTIMPQFIKLAHFLSKYPHQVIFGKIEMYKNSLPMELTPEKIPAFVYFKGTKIRRIFPIGEKMSPKSLLKFLLNQMEPEERIRMSPHLNVEKSKSFVDGKILDILSSLASNGAKIDTNLNYEAKIEELSHLGSLQLLLSAKKEL